MVVRKEETCNLVLQVARGHRFPSRVRAEAESKGLRGDDALEPAELMVEARFGDAIDSTPTAPGPNPQWNTQLLLPISPPRGEFTPSALLSMTESLCINVFDRKVFRSAIADDTSKNSSQERIEKRWLGSLTVPWATIFRRTRIDGSFVLEIPGHFIGYRGAEGGPTMLSLYITLDPPLQTPEVVEPPPPSLGKEISSFVSDWHAEIAAAKPPPSRSYSAAGLTLDGHWALISRFVSPQSVPPGLTTPEQLARFVRLVPFIDDWSGESNEDGAEKTDVWCTSAEFLQLQAGDWEEHAVLLANYLLSIGKNAYVVLGKVSVR